jgi:hypothetical protein
MEEYDDPEMPLYTNCLSEESSPHYAPSARRGGDVIRKSPIA